MEEYLNQHLHSLLIKLNRESRWNKKRPRIPMARVPYHETRRRRRRKRRRRRRRPRRTQRRKMRRWRRRRRRRRREGLGSWIDELRVRNYDPHPIRMSTSHSPPEEMKTDGQDLRIKGRRWEFLGFLSLQLQTKRD